MELKEFTKKAILEIVGAVEDARGESKRDMRLGSTSGTRTIEFDIAVSAEEGAGKEGNAGIRVWQVLEGGGKISSESKNSTVTRIKFGVHVSEMNKDEQAHLDAKNKEWENQQFKTE
jgi:hypothetical protein